MSPFSNMEITPLPRLWDISHDQLENTLCTVVLFKFKTPTNLFGSCYMYRRPPFIRQFRLSFMFDESGDPSDIVSLRGKSYINRVLKSDDLFWYPLQRDNRYEADINTDKLKQAIEKTRLLPDQLYDIYRQFLEQNNKHEKTPIWKLCIDIDSRDFDSTMRYTI